LHLLFIGVSGEDGVHLFTNHGEGLVEVKEAVVIGEESGAVGAREARVGNLSEDTQEAATQFAEAVEGKSTVAVATEALQALDDTFSVSEDGTKLFKSEFNADGVADTREMAVEGILAINLDGFSGEIEVGELEESPSAEELSTSQSKAENAEFTASFADGSTNESTRNFSTGQLVVLLGSLQCDLSSFNIALCGAVA